MILIIVTIKLRKTALLLIIILYIEGELDEIGFYRRREYGKCDN